jgi:hypothetical protein
MIRQTSGSCGSSSTSARALNLVHTSCIYLLFITIYIVSSYILFLTIILFYLQDNFGKLWGILYLGAGLLNILIFPIANIAKAMGSFREVTLIYVYIYIYILYTIVFYCISFALYYVIFSIAYIVKAVGSFREMILVVL